MFYASPTIRTSAGLVLFLACKCKYVSGCMKMAAFVSSSCLCKTCAPTRPSKYFCNIFKKGVFGIFRISKKTLLGDNRKFNIKGKLNLSDNGKDRAYRNNIKQKCIYQFSKWLANRIIRSYSHTFKSNANGQYFGNDSGRSNILIYRWISLQSCIMLFGNLQSTKRPLHFRFILSEGYHVVAPV